MTTKNSANAKLFDHPVIGFVGFLASVLGIIMFLTGRQQIADFFSPTAMVQNPAGVSPAEPPATEPFSNSRAVVAMESRRVPTAVPTTTLTFTPGPTQTPTITPYPTLAPIAYPGLAFELKDYTGEQISGMDSEVIIYAYAGQELLDPHSTKINCTRLEGDGTRKEGDCSGSYDFWTYEDGSFKAYPDQEGYWSIHYQDNREMTIDCYADAQFSYPLIPVEPGKSTQATIRFGILQVQVLEANGKAAKSANVELARAQTTRGSDGTETHKACNAATARHTDHQGVARFVVVEGAYAARSLGDKKDKNGDWLTDIYVEAGQEVRVAIGK
jgi:hypothetical protein